MKIVSEPVLIDTNVLIYHTFYDFDKDKNQLSVKILNKLYQNKNLLVISPQIIREFISISTNIKFFKKPLNKKQVINKIEEFAKYFKLIYESENTLTILKEFILKYNIEKTKIHDANIIATMLDNNVTNIFSFNIKDFKKFKEINLINLN